MVFRFAHWHFLLSFQCKYLGNFIEDNRSLSLQLFLKDVNNIFVLKRKNDGFERKKSRLEKENSGFEKENSGL